MVRPPKGSTRSVKYIIDEAQGTSGTALDTFKLAKGVDDETLGQTSVTDHTVPTGTKIKQFNIMTCWGSITGVSTFLHWSIQRIRSGQTFLNPRTQGGNPLRNNIMMSGIMCIGDKQNATLDIKYKVPKSMWRMGDNTEWALVTICSTNVDTVKQCIFKVFD